MSHYPNNERGIRGPGSGSFGESPASGPAPTTAGHHKHDILNKLDPRVDSTHDRAPVQAMTGGNNVPAGTYGPHTSRLANALDPRVDSDRDGRAAQGVSGRGGGMVGGMTGAGAGAAAGYGAGPVGNPRSTAPEGTYGPHTSRVANALDPRVDSDRDGRGGMYAGQSGSGYPHDGTTGAGYGQHAMSGAVPSGPGPAPNTAGPHKSDLMNKLDPRVDSKTGVMKESGYSERRGI
ncbi:hypothetical protein B0T16DRAFT_410301 [Cercophora newfieldiana]|uniref:Uncharacterized protein n=1 Tax=Cercophora newfieldiana TaxID=92897 RepID=A0AA40CS80_9PEZI|nr:hypothetical protein B0T16DRAFT_410301 [Cercophora newfieldiana]